MNISSCGFKSRLEYIAKASDTVVSEAFSIFESRLLSVELSVDGLVEKDKMQNTFDFKKAELVKSNSRSGWYIKYYVWDVQKNDLVRKRKFIPSTYTTSESKEAYAINVIKKVNHLLKKGYHIDRNKARERKLKVDEKVSIPTFDESILNYEKYCQNIKKNSPKEVREKKNSLTKLSNWVKENYNIFYLSEISPQVALKYFDNLLVVDGVGAKTFNNTLGRVRTFYTTAVKRDWTEKGKESPFKDVERQSVDYGEKNIPYSIKQAKEIKEFILETDPYLWKFISFIYYAFMRPSEIRRIKIKDFDLDKKLLRIPSSQSKVKKYDILPLAPQLIKVVEDMDLDSHQADDYLFTTIEKPSRIQMGNGWSTSHFKKVKDHFGFDENYSIYGFKHTAVCRWYEQDKDIVRIQKMCRHSTIEMTARYLKSLGLLTDVYKIDTLPEI